jgi:predicted glycoside hydrolase/deacetylase ChbG (UPF0249 family)
LDLSAGKMKGILFLACFIFILPVIGGAQETRLIIRGDDLGMTQGTLAAFERAFNQGVLTCSSIIVPGPWFEGAAELCKKNPGWCTGVHLCLVGEWRGMRWRPVLPWDKVSSIVDEDGFLYTSPEDLFANQPKLDQIDAEFRAQIELAGKKGINIQYLDTHYMSTKEPGYPGLAEILRKIGRDYNLPVSGHMSEQGLGIGQVPFEQKKDEALKMLEELEPGLWLWICHPGIDSPEQDALIHSKREDIFTRGGVGRHRAEILNTLTSLELKSVILQKGIVLTNYRELWNEKNK